MTPETSFDVAAADENHFVTVDITSLVKEWVVGDPMTMTPFDNNFGLALVAIYDDGKFRIGTKETDDEHEMQIEIALGVAMEKAGGEHAR